MNADVEAGPTDAELVDLLEIAAVGTVESALVNDGSCVPPTVHMISALSPSPYVGYLVSRPFYRGDDAATAVADMGALPAALSARRLVLTWEHADLSTALELPGAPFPTAQVVVDAHADGHEVRWHPFDMNLGPPAASGLPTVVPAWGEAQRVPEGALPAPVVELLRTWRRGRDPRELRALHGRMENDGYMIRWVTSKDDREARYVAGPGRQ